MQLKLLDPSFGILKLTPPQSFPAWLTGAGVYFIAQTDDEFSIMCPQQVIPPNVEYDPHWRCLRADGDLAYDAVGVVAKLSKPLADAGMSLFLVSTHDRDYVFVRAADLERALQIYRENGFTFSFTL